MTFENIKLRVPFRIELDGEGGAPFIHMQPIWNDVKRQYIISFDINESLANWYEYGTNFLYCEFRHHYVWTPVTEQDIQNFGPGAVDCYSLFVFLEKPTEYNFSNLLVLIPAF